MFRGDQMSSLHQWLAVNSWAGHLVFFVIFYICYLMILQALKKLFQQWRIRRLLQTYGDPVLVNNILEQVPWEGETMEQIRISFGRSMDCRNEILNGRPVRILDIARNVHEGYVVTMQNDKVIAWRLLKS